MKGTKTRLTTAPEGFEYYRVCDQEGVCQVVRGMWAAQHLTEDIRELSATKKSIQLIGFRTLNDNPFAPLQGRSHPHQKKEIEQVERSLAALTTTEERP